jgi:hypothetical protein
LAIFFSIFQQEVSVDIIQNLAAGNISPKTEGTKTKAGRCFFSYVFSLPVHFEFFAIFSYCLRFFCQVCLLVKETAEIETGMAEKSSWDQTNIRQKLGFV